MAAKQEVILSNEQPAPVPAFSFQDMQRMAASIAKSNLFGVKDADQALSLMMIAQAEGKHPALIARDYDIIQGRPAKKAEAILRDFQATGGRVEWHTMTDVCSDATFSHPLSVKPVRIMWDMERAKKAGLVGKPGGMYDKYARAMLRARVVSEGCRAVAPSATSGFYTPEEIRDFDTKPHTAQQIAATADALEIVAPPQEEVEAYINSMDVTTETQLKEMFKCAWRSTEHAQTRARYKATYDSMIEEVKRLEAQARDFTEATS